MKWIYKKLTGGLFIQENVWGAFCGIACCEIHLWWGHKFLYLRARCPSLIIHTGMYPYIWYLRPCDYAQRYFTKFMENVCNEKTVPGFQFSFTKIDLPFQCTFPWIFFRLIYFKDRERKIDWSIVYLLVHSLNAVNSHSRTRLKPEFRNSIRVFPMDFRDQTTWAITSGFQGAPQLEALQTPACCANFPKSLASSRKTEWHFIYDFHLATLSFYKTTQSDLTPLVLR